MAEGGHGARSKTRTVRESTEEISHDPSAKAAVHIAPGYAFLIVNGVLCETQNQAAQCNTPPERIINELPIATSYRNHRSAERTRDVLNETTSAQHDLYTERSRDVLPEERKHYVAKEKTSTQTDTSVEHISDTIQQNTSSQTNMSGERINDVAQENAFVQHNAFAELTIDASQENTSIQNNASAENPSDVPQESTSTNNDPISEGATTVPIRYGAEHDIDSFRAVFVTKYGMEWKNEGAHTELTISDFDHELKVGKQQTCAFTSKDSPEQTSCTCTCICCQVNSLDFSNTDKIVLVISSHGKEDVEPMISMNGKKRLRRSDIIKGLGDKRCPGLVGKLRIIMISCCRVDKKKPEKDDDKGATLKVDQRGQTEADFNDLHDRNDDAASDVDAKDVDSVDDTDVIGMSEKREVLEIPRDFIFVHSVPIGISKRESGEGAWMLKELVDAANDDRLSGNTVNFMQVLTLTNKRVCELETKIYKKIYENGTAIRYERENGKLIPDTEHEKFGLKNTMCIEHRLTKGVYFRTVIAPDQPMPERFY